MAVKQLGVGATSVDDIVDKGYVDGALASNTKAMFSLSAPASGWYDAPSGYIAGGTTGSARTNQRQTFTPFLVGPSGTTYDSFVQQVTTAQSGGALTYMVAIYGSDQYSMPDTVTGPLVVYTSTAPAASTGLKVYTFTSQSTLTMQPGVYWISTLMIISSTPTTAPVWVPMNNSSWSIPLTSGTTSLTNNVRGYYIASRTTMISGAAFSASSPVPTSGLDLPYTALRRA